MDCLCTFKLFPQKVLYVQLDATVNNINSKTSVSISLLPAN